MILNKPNVAVIITGDVRNCKAKEIIKTQVSNYDVFCGSYVKHETFINELGKNNYKVLIDPNNDIILPNGITKENMQQNMLQWLHLNNIIKKYKNKLMEYDIIIKLRLDIILNIENCSYISHIQELNYNYNTIYCHSDIIFACHYKVFIDLFEDFYDKIIYMTYPFNKNNYTILDNTWRSENAFRFNSELKKINRINFLFKIYIDRGDYNKERGDGNRNLYHNNKLMGKFS